MLQITLEDRIALGISTRSDSSQRGFPANLGKRTTLAFPRIFGKWGLILRAWRLSSTPLCLRKIGLGAFWGIYAATAAAMNVLFKPVSGVEAEISRGYN